MTAATIGNKKMATTNRVARGTRHRLDEAVLADEVRFLDDGAIGVGDVGWRAYSGE
jgi:hypothetical protein